MQVKLVAVLVGCLALTSCASVGGLQERYLVCPYDVLWEATLDAVKDRPVLVKDKTKGVIETDWLEVPVSRAYGVFQRELAEAKDRTKVYAEVKRLEDVSKVSFAETRQRWKFRGGSRLFGWDAAEPSEEDMAKLMDRLTNKLKEQGCTLT
jgi:hypothetical protein